MSKKVAAILICVVIIVAAVAGAFVVMVMMRDGGDGDNGNGNNPGPGPNTSDRNNAPSRAIVVSEGDSVAGEIKNPREALFYKAELDPGDVLSLSLSGDAGTDLDLVVLHGMRGSRADIIDGSFNDGSTESLEIVAWDTGWYLIEVYSYEGTGGFTLHIGTSAPVAIDDGDNDFASAKPITSGGTFEGTLNANYDEDDYYKVDLDANDFLDVRLTVPKNSDFDIYIYDDYDHETAINASNAVYGDEHVGMTVQTAGTYYIDAWAYEGMGDYVLTVSFGGTSATDDDNGILEANTLVPGTVSDSVSEYTDTCDYYKIYLRAGTVLSVVLDGPSGTDYDLWLWDENIDIVEDYEGETPSSHEEIYFPVNTTMYYYVIVYAYEGSGGYTMDTAVLGEVGSPNAVLRVDNTKPVVGETITCSGAYSTGGEYLYYSWDFGDGEVQEGDLPEVEHTYHSVGSFTVTLTVSYAEVTDSATATISVGPASTTTITKYAVVVGVADYKDIRDLYFPDDDARSWRDFLTEEGYTVHILTDSQATRQAIMSEIEWMKSVEDENSYCVFTFAGHGGFDDYQRESCICCYDTGTYDFSGTINDTQLAEAFAGFESQHIFFFFQCCFAGGMDSVTGTGRYVSQTCRPDEYGWDSPRFRHGTWTYWFLISGIIEQGYRDMVACYDYAYPLAKDDDPEYLCHPEEEYTGVGPFYLTTPRTAG